ncbi:phage holin family protein [Gilvimarinus agarilyticus]|uniref:phage holin family protein n=1 Tax=Gilvimarinus agarilyticus TaxID=679259 RepID=UPI0005A2DDDF|nr:phage holin family protein [Gilvimarinus agarilyticus]
MPYKDPNNFNALTVALMLVLAAWGGTVNYLTRIKRGTVHMFSFIELLGEMCISCFSGVLVYLIGASYNVPPLLLAAMVGVAGHAGGRTAFYLETVFNSKLDTLTKTIQKNEPKN